MDELTRYILMLAWHHVEDENELGKAAAALLEAYGAEVKEDANVE